MSGQCRTCIYVGGPEQCFGSETLCSKHDDWVVCHLRAELEEKDEEIERERTKLRLLLLTVDFDAVCYALGTMSPKMLLTEEIEDESDEYFLSLADAVLEDGIKRAAMSEEGR